MRRALLAVSPAARLVTGTACDTDREPTDAAPAGGPPRRRTARAAAARLLGEHQTVCGRLETVYNGELRAFDAAMGKMITYKEAKRRAEASKAENAAVAQLKAAGVKIARRRRSQRIRSSRRPGWSRPPRWRRSVRDRKYFDG